MTIFTSLIESQSTASLESVWSISLCGIPCECCGTQLTHGEFAISVNCCICDMNIQLDDALEHSDDLYHPHEFL